MRYAQKSRGASNTGLTIAGADGEIAKTFIIQRFRDQSATQPSTISRISGSSNVFFKQARNAGAFAVAACVKVVAADGFADQTYFRQHDAAATVGATGYAQNDYSSSKPVLRLIYKKGRLNFAFRRP